MRTLATSVTVGIYKSKNKLGNAIKKLSFIALQIISATYYGGILRSHVPQLAERSYRGATGHES